MGLGSITKKLMIGLFALSAVSVGAVGIVGGGLKIAEVKLARLEKQDDEAKIFLMGKFIQAKKLFESDKYSESLRQLEEGKKQAGLLRRTIDKKEVYQMFSVLEQAVLAQIEIENKNYEKALDHIINGKGIIKTTDIKNSENIDRLMREIESRLSIAIKEKKQEEVRRKIGPLYNSALIEFQKDRYQNVKELLTKALGFFKKARLEEETGLINTLKVLSRYCESIREKLDSDDYSMVKPWIEDARRLVEKSEFPHNDKVILIEKLNQFQIELDEAAI